MKTAKKKIAVVGAGIAGLTCAYELQRAGYEVTVFEKETWVGGRMASRTNDGLIFDIGADHLCNLYTGIQAYCKEFDIPWEKMQFLKYGVAKGGKIVSHKDCVGFISRLRMALQYFFTPRTSSFLDLSGLAHYDTQNARAFMQQRCGKEVVDYLVDPFVSTYQFHRSDEISKAALQGVMSCIKYQQPLWYLHHTKGGMSALPEAFCKRLKVHVATPVTSVQGGDTVSITSTHEEVFDTAVLASSTYDTELIYKNPTPSQAFLLKSTTYASTISIAFRVPRAQLPQDTAIVWVPYVENQCISGFVNEAMKGDEVVRNDMSLISVWLHEEFAKSIIDKSDNEIFETVQQEFVKVCPWVKNIEQLEPFDMQRWPWAMPKFSQGHIQHVAQFLQKGQGERNVYFAGDYLNSPWTEGALRCGQRVAQSIIQTSKEMT